MKSSLNYFDEYQLWLLNDGSYILITSVEPESKIKSSDKVRNVYGKQGKKRGKGDEFESNSIVIENPLMSVDITINTNKNLSYTIAELYAKSAKYMGKLTPNKIEQFNRIND